MIRKIIAIAIVGCFLLTGLFSVSTVGLKLKTNEALPDLRVDSYDVKYYKEEKKIRFEVSIINCGETFTIDHETPIAKLTVNGENLGQYSARYTFSWSKNSLAVAEWYISQPYLSDYHNFTVEANPIGAIDEPRDNNIKTWIIWIRGYKSRSCSLLNNLIIRFPLLAKLRNFKQNTPISNPAIDIGTMSSIDGDPQINIQDKTVSVNAPCNINFNVEAKLEENRDSHKAYTPRFRNEVTSGGFAEWIPRVFKDQKRSVSNTFGSNAFIGSNVQEGDELTFKVTVKVDTQNGKLTDTATVTIVISKARSR